MKISKAAFFVLIFGFCTQARAEEPVVWVCDPQNEGLHVLMQSPGERHSAELVLNGSLETPTPGYSYAFDHESDGSGGEVVVLRLRGPSGVAASVISRLVINERFGVDPATKRLSISVEKKFNWGVDKIICEPLP